MLITADDRTGALEVAGACADAGLGSVPVATGRSVAAVGPWSVRVVDVASRHLQPSDAAAAVVGVMSAAGTQRCGHKIDSTLRGHWAVEVAGLVESGRRALVVPALPALGRTCVAGQVLVGATPVHETAAGTDARMPVVSSRPVDHLIAAGVAGVVHLRSADEVAAWAAGESAVAVCDAATDTDLDLIAERWARVTDAAIVLVGTAASVAAGAISLHRSESSHTSRPSDGSSGSPVRPVLDAPVVVVCGSLHPAARSQVAALRSAALGDVEIIESPLPMSVPVDPTEAAAWAATLAARVVETDSWRTLVVLGGDTAAAVLGDDEVVVGGTTAPGAPWMRRPDGRVVVTRSGGFGGAMALVDLLTGDPTSRMG